MLGASLLLGGLRYHVQEYNRNSARLQGGLLFLATIAMLIPSVLAEADGSATNAAFTRSLSVGLSVLLIVTYALGLAFSLKTHHELFASEEHGESGENEWPLRLALGTLAAVTALVALVSEVFVESVQQAATTLGRYGVRYFRDDTLPLAAANVALQIGRRSRPPEGALVHRGSCA